VSDFALSHPSGLDIFLAPPSPEKAELVAPRAGLILRDLRRRYDLVCVNTGAFWTLLHAEIMDASDVILMLLAPRASSVRATVLAKALCHRLGVPDAKVSYVMNRYTGRGAVSARDAAAALQANEVVPLADGGPEVSAYLDAGDPCGLMGSKGALVSGVYSLTDRTLDRLKLGSVEATRSAVVKRRWWG